MKTTKLLFALSVFLFFIVNPALFIVGITGSQPLFLLLSLTCGMYLFVGVFVAAMVRFTLQFEIQPKQTSRRTSTGKRPTYDATFN